MPTPIFLPPIAHAVRGRGGPPRAALTSLVLGLGLAVLGAGLAPLGGGWAAPALLLSVVMLGAAYALQLRALWAAAAPRTAADVRASHHLGPPSQPGTLSARQVSQGLARLREAYVYEVNLVLEDGREDLARKLSDAYTDEALHLIASA